MDFHPENDDFSTQNHLETSKPNKTQLELGKFIKNWSVTQGNLSG